MKKVNTPILYIEARKKFSDKIDFSSLDKLEGKTISLAAVIQYLDLVPLVKKYLEKKGKKVTLKKGAFYDAHSIGCNSSCFDKKCDTLLLIGDGKFQAINNAIQLDKEIFVYNPESFEKITKKEIEEIRKKIKGKINKFLSYNIVGLLVSTKYGQYNKNFIELKHKIEKLGKKVYVFEGDNINIGEFENFPGISIWVNTACYGMAIDDNRILNFQDILEFL